MAHVDPKMVDFSTSWPYVGHLGHMSGQLGPMLGPSWAQVGPKLGQVGPKLGPSWASWCQVGGKLGQVGAMWIFQEFWREPGREGTPNFAIAKVFWPPVHTEQQLAVEYKQQLRNCKT